MDRAQLLNDAEEAMRLVLDGRQSNIWTSMPGIIQAVDLTAMTCAVQPAIQAKVENETGAITLQNLPLLLDVPIVYPSAGGFTLTFPIKAGDEVLVVFACRCIDAWWQLSEVQRPLEARMHDLSDGFAVPGPRSSGNVLGSISSSKVQLRNDAGDTYLGMGTKFAMKNATTDLKTLLSNFESAMSSFLSALAALGVVGSATNASLSIPAAAAVAALGTVVTEINALLETA